MCSITWLNLFDEKFLYGVWRNIDLINDLFQKEDFEICEIFIF